MRAGKWKLIEWFEDQRVELYDLESDEREEKDLAGEQQTLVKQLKVKLSNWRTSVKRSHASPTHTRAHEYRPDGSNLEMSRSPT